MIRFIQGGTGSGKTYYTVKEAIVARLRSDPRHIVTNLTELKLPELNAYLQKLDGVDAPDIHERLTVIQKTQTSEFYRHRSARLILPPPPEKGRDGRKLPYDQWKQEILPYFEQIYNRPETSEGVIYVMDETHIHFNALEWGEIGRTVQFYVSQHRHLRDDVFFITQVPEQVAAGLRRLGNEFICLRNHYRESFGMFRKPGAFLWSKYYALPKDSMTPDDKGEFKLDPLGVGSCYKTTGALGGKDSTPEAQEKSKKLPFWMLPVAVVAVVLLVGALLMATPKIAQKAIGAALGGVTAGVQDGLSKGLKKAPKKEPEGVSKSETPAKVLEQKPPEEKSTIVAVSKNSANVPTVRGYVSRGDKVNVLLSDGRILTEADPVFKLSRRRWEVDGNTTYQKEEYTPPPQQQQSVQAQNAPQPQQPQGVAPAGEKVSDSGTGSWRTDADGVTRLVNPDSLATLGKTTQLR